MIPATGYKIWIEQEEIEFDADEIEDMRHDDIRQCTRDLLLVERAREWLLEDNRSS